MQLMTLLRLKCPVMEDVMIARTLSAFILIATLVATPGIAEAGAVKDKLQGIKQSIKLDVKDNAC
jgi:hypothetical protein